MSVLTGDDERFDHLGSDEVAVKLIQFGQPEVVAIKVQAGSRRIVILMKGADHDLSGFNFWLHKLDDNGGDFHKAEMVKAFMVAGEYRGRFVW